MSKCVAFYLMSAACFAGALGMLYLFITVPDSFIFAVTCVILTLFGVGYFFLPRLKKECQDEP